MPCKFEFLNVFFKAGFFKKLNLQQFNVHVLEKQLSLK